MKGVGGGQRGSATMETHHRMPRWLVVVASLLALAAAQTQRVPAAKGPAHQVAGKSALHKPTLEAYVRHLFVWGPQVNVSISDPQPSARLPGFFEVNVHATAGAASQEELFYISRDGKKILKAVVFDVDKNPFYEDLAKLNTQFQPSFGAPGAPVVLVLFSDFQCGYCKEEAETLRKNIPATFPKQVRVYFKDFPLESIHPWAKPAAIAGRCIFRQRPASFWEYHDWIYQHQSEITPENLKTKVMEFARAREKQIDVLQLQRCLDGRETEAEVDRNIADGKALQVNSTPTLFVNGRKLVGNIGWTNLRQIIEYEIGYQQTANNAGERCCEVVISSPVNK